MKSLKYYPAYKELRVHVSEIITISLPAHMFGIYHKISDTKLPHSHLNGKIKKWKYIYLTLLHYITRGHEICKILSAFNAANSINIQADNKNKAKQKYHASLSKILSFLEKQEVIFAKLPLTQMLCRVGIWFCIEIVKNLFRIHFAPGRVQTPLRAILGYWVKVTVNFSNTSFYNFYLNSDL